MSTPHTAATSAAADIPNLPTVPMHDVGQGWRRVAIGEPIRSSFQCYSMVPQCGVGIGKPRGWQLGSYYTREMMVNQGGAHYRAAASLRAWLSICVPLTRKLARGYWRLLWHGTFV